MKNLCRSIKVWKISELSLGKISYEIGKDYSPQILKEISSIEFPNLSKLIIYENILESIESLHRIFLPALT